MSEPVKLLGRMLNFSTLIIRSADLTVIEAELKKKLGGMSDAGGIPVVVDSEHQINLPELFDLLWSIGFQPIGVVEGILSQQATEQKIAIFPKGKPLKKIETKSDQGRTMIHDRMVRSGQSINNAEGDLVLMDGINDGAEAIATGSLHVYGNASGRLVAGATGEPSASIFCQKLSASLVSVAGVWCTKEDIPKDKLNKAVYIKYEEETGLVFTLMNSDVV